MSVRNASTSADESIPALLLSRSRELVGCVAGFFLVAYEMFFIRLCSDWMPETVSVLFFDWMPETLSVPAIKGCVSLPRNLCSFRL